MASDVVVITSFIQGLRTMLSQQGNLLDGNQDQVRSILREFEGVGPFLMVADKKHQTDDRVRRWLSDMRNLADDASGIIRKLVPGAQKFHSICHMLMSCKMKATAGIFRRPSMTFYRLESIQESVQKLREEASSLGLKRPDKGQPEKSPSFSIGGSSGKGFSLRSTSKRVAVVAHELEAKALTKQLMNGVDERRHVISVVGMEGIGKTTIAHKVYNSRVIRRHFDCRAWVHVCKEHGVKDLLQGVLKSLGMLRKEEMALLNEEELMVALAGYLDNVRYLIVFDDMWAIENWEKLFENTLPERWNGSRVMLTACNERNIPLLPDEIAYSVCHKLRLLSKQESWGMFCEKAFPENNGECPPQLEALGRQLVECCYGLPLAVTVLGGILSRRKPLPVEWEQVLKAMEEEPMNDVPGPFSRVFALCYDNLPDYLEDCFLYLGIFPEGFEIPTRKLIHLWVAEGFFQQREDKAELEEDIAQNCLEELIHWNVIQVVKVRSDGSAKTCRIQEHFRKVSVSKAYKDCFVAAFPVLLAPVLAEQLLSSSPRLAIHENTDQFMALNPPMPHLRSFLCFDQKHRKEEHQTRWLRVLLSTEKSLHAKFTQLKHLWVLELEGTAITKLPDEIGGFVYLKYLGLRWTKLESLPLSAENLQNLQTLDLRFTSITQLPDAIQGMQQLRHLYLNKNISVGNSCSVESLTNLQTISVMQTGAWMKDGLCKLTNLRKLGISGDLSFCNEALSDLDKLRSLHVAFDLGKTVLNMKSLPNNLVKLHSERRLKNSPSFLQSLRILSLRWSRLEEDPFDALKQLRNLQRLLLCRGSFVGKKMVCPAGVFPRLEFLKLNLLNNLEEWEVEEGALPCLNHLVIRLCRQLKKLPEGLPHLTNLNKLEISFMPDNFLEQHKIAHIESTYIDRDKCFNAEGLNSEARSQGPN